MGDDPAAQLAALRLRVRERLDQLNAVPTGAQARAAACDEVFEATAALIDYEQRLPVLLDQAPRRLSLLIVRWSGVVTGAVGAAVAAVAVAGWTSRWLVLIALPALVAATILLRLRVHPPRGRHLALRPGAVLVALGALSSGFGAAIRLPLPVSVVGVLVLAAGLWQVQRHPVGSPARQARR